VELLVKVVNNTNETISFRKPEQAGIKFLSVPFDLYIFVETIEGEFVPFDGLPPQTLGGFSNEDFVLIQPNEPLELNYSFDIPIALIYHENTDEYIPEPLPPGTYQLLAYYYNSRIGPKVDGYWYDNETWVGEMESNRVEFEMPDLGD
ncbi:MAG: hypothetical protein ACTSO6_08200, partial [Promethearchaeota archaeon]